MVWVGDGDCYLGVLRFESQTSGPQTTNLPCVEKGDASMGRFFGVFTPWVHLQFPSRKALHTLSSPSPCRISKLPRSLRGGRREIWHHGTSQLFPLKNAPAIKIGQFFVDTYGGKNKHIISYGIKMQVTIFRKATCFTSDLLIFACGRRLLSRGCELFFQNFKPSTGFAVPFIWGLKTLKRC